MSIVYGYDTARTNDPYVEYADRGVRAIGKATNPKTAALLGMFPLRRSHRMSYYLTQPSPSPETTYMDTRLAESGSRRGKALRYWVSHSSFCNGTRTNGAHLFLFPN